MTINTKDVRKGQDRSSVLKQDNEVLIDSARRMENSFYGNEKGKKQIKLEWDNVIRPLTAQDLKEEGSQNNNFDEKVRERLDTERS